MAPGGGTSAAGLVAATSRIASLGRAGDAASARAMFDAMPRRDAVAWNAMLTAYVRAGQPRDALTLFSRAPAPDAFSLTAALSAAAALRSPVAGAQLHARLIRAGLRALLPVGNTLVDMYAKCARADDAARAFGEMRERNALSWCSLLHAYVVSDHLMLAQELFDQMPNRNNVAWNTLLMGYSRSGNANQCLLLFNKMRAEGMACDGATLCILADACTELAHPSAGSAIHKVAVQSGWSAMAELGCVEKATSLFRRVPETNVISWTAMIGGLARNGCADEALALFIVMLAHEHIHPDDFTFGSVLHACATAASLASGRMVHCRAFRSGFAAYLYVANSLMDMYAKCGDVEGGTNVFGAIVNKDLVSWNTMLFGFAINGWANEALVVYDSMKSHEVCPDEVTFAGLLTACNHSGLLEHGESFFESMVSVHGIQPKPEHLSCILDMYARSGNITKAMEMLDLYSETIRAHNSDIREALLSACSLEHLNFRVARKAMEDMVATKSAGDVGYVMLSNLFCAAGQWNQAEQVRIAMAEHGIKKTPGCSWIEVQGAVKVFASVVCIGHQSSQRPAL
uniref:Pentatricopeptide repeat-containing protein n=1 Tax=Zea mays TaxID=4577 RepID=A0A804MPY6_MAIZE